ncbi:MAG: YggS family pyridoxal phosphate-dependent enzyme [Spirochaetaceae bacterium]|nr:YggS family pyridoxal phosphate-dependent enzyme [Spirochaetaceae bacterium]
MSNVAQCLQQVLTSIRRAESVYGRKPNSVKLVAVSKFHPVESVLEATSAGQILFGENRVQEAVTKFEQVRLQVPNVELHIIGQLQRNKVKNAISVASCIQSVDRIELLEEIEKQASKKEKKIQVFFEFHTAEDSKSGYTNLDEVFKSLEYCQKTNYIEVVGFMTMAPFTQNHKLIASSFKKLVEVQHKAQSRFPDLQLDELSMGMSNDYEIAISEGATIVRIGSAIFGSRV